MKTTKTKCPLCGVRFEIKPKQKKAQWAKNWCTSESGYLCDDCHEAAKQLGCVSNSEINLGVLPFASDIMNISKSPKLDRNKVNDKYKLETWKHWIEEEDY